MATFVSQVWETTELAEMILLHLPLRDLLLSKRVSKEWYQVHTGSDKIQVALFLKSFNNYTVDFDSQNIPQIRDTRAFMHNGNPIFNPFLNILVDKDHAKHSGTVCLMSDSFINGINAEDDDHPLYGAPEWLATFHEERSSTWRQMVLTQPAPYMYYGWCSGRLIWFFQAGKHIAQDDNGVKVGKIHKMLREHSCYCINCPRIPYEIARWGWNGEDDVEMMDIETTGWEMYEQIKARSMG